jgi:cytochrome c biogenesis protein CcmG/thiol:disulfide interchange protein DsbE
VETRTSRPPGLIGPFTGRQLVAAVAVVAVAALGLTVITTPIASPPAGAQPAAGASFVPFAQPQEGLRVGDAAPELVGQGGGIQLADLDGHPIRLAELRGRPVWLNFFASWCPPCQQETPTLERIYETHRAQGLAIVGISVQETSVDDVRAYAATYGLAYTIGFDATSAIYHAYHVYGLPTQVFVDRNGVVRAVVNGPLSELQGEQILAPLLEP